MTSIKLWNISRGFIATGSMTFCLLEISLFKFNIYTNMAMYNANLIELMKWSKECITLNKEYLEMFQRQTHFTQKFLSMIQLWLI